jgi:hypothetical protein
MPLDAANAAPDALLAEFLAAAEGEAAREALGRLLEREASPLIWKVLRRQLGGAGAGTQRADVEDLHAELLLKLQLQLLAARRGERPAPASLLDYVAAAAYNAAAGFRMARHPERTRLRDRVRYVLRRESTLASWSGRDRELVCGLARDAGRDAASALDTRLAALAATFAAEHGGGWGRFPRLVVALLVELDRPCRLEELVAALAGALGIEEPVAAAIDDEPVEGRRGAVLVDPAPTASERLAAVERVARVWAEIADLPLNQRFALLVNLRGESGEALLEELLATGVVERAALASALGIAPAELAALLPELPRDDLWIAARLGLSRQQVINLRKSARLRLARRLRGRRDGVG